MRRAERLFEIVQILRRARRPVPARAMADELETSQRSIYRDIAALVAQRVPIRGEAGIGYVLEPGFDMPPLMLSAIEVEAAVLGAQWVASRGDPELARAALDLIAKIENVVPERLRPYVDQPATSLAPPAENEAERINVTALRHAIRAGRKVAVHYRGSDGQETRRLVWPVLVGYRDAGRILAAWCELRTGFRFFRTERMVAAEVLDERFPERPATLRARWRKAMDEEREAYRLKAAS